MILKQGHRYRAMPHDGKLIAYIYRGGRCYYHDGPYSLAATQALRAAFPQYWTAICDYGWANPQLVPFINEDPMLVCSLGLEVQGFTMPIRWLKSNNGGYFATGKTIISGDVVTFGAMFPAFNIENMFGWRENEQVGVVIFPSSNSAWHKAFGGTTSQTENRITLQTNKAYEFEMSQQGLFVWNNALQRTSMNMTQVGNTFPNHEYYIFSGGNNGSLDTRTFSGLLSRHQINNGGVLRIMFVPKKVNGNWELLDVVSGDYAVRSGSFNMSYTLPDGTPWTPPTDKQPTQ